MAMAHLEIKNLAKQFAGSSRAAVEALNLSIEPGN